MHDLFALLTSKSLSLVTAESCTGGMIAAAITDIPGSSNIFERGFVTYSNESKQELLGVPAEITQTHGAVSEQCACAMAEGALKNSRADIAVSVTGIAGPDGGTPEKPVGLVYIGISILKPSLHGQVVQSMDHTHKACDDDWCDTRVTQHIFTGTRQDIRQSTLLKALDLLADTARAI